MPDHWSCHKSFYHFLILLFFFNEKFLGNASCLLHYATVLINGQFLFNISIFIDSLGPQILRIPPWNVPCIVLGRWGWQKIKQMFTWKQRGNTRLILFKWLGQVLGYARKYRISLKKNVFNLVDFTEKILD